MFSHRFPDAFAFLTIALILLQSEAMASFMGKDLILAPPPFIYMGKQTIPVDFEFMDLYLTFDVSTKKTYAKAKIEFYSGMTGYPFLDLVPEPTKVRLNGIDLGPSGLPIITSPDMATPLRMVAKRVKSYSRNTLEIEYEFPEEMLEFTASGVRVALFMSDLKRRKFLELHAPSNLEFDHFQITIHVEVLNATKSHRIFTNGDVKSVGDYSWKVTFPSYFTASSLYFHLSDDDFHIEEYMYRGVGRIDVPVTVYSKIEGYAVQMMEKSIAILDELEDSFGAYSHKKLVIYVTEDLSGGMEYCGATTSSRTALSHELSHSWFARGVMPSDGNSGWIDEAIAVWRDYGYPSWKHNSHGPEINLAGFSKYRRHTPRQAYHAGSTLMIGFNFLFQSQGGLKPVLKALFQNYSLQSISTPMFKVHLEKETGQDLDRVFKHFVYGEPKYDPQFPMFMPPTLNWVPRISKSKHPRAYTDEEHRAML